MTKKDHSCPECDKRRKEMEKYARIMEDNNNE